MRWTQKYELSRSDQALRTAFQYAARQRGYAGARHQHEARALFSVIYIPFH